MRLRSSAPAVQTTLCGITSHRSVDTIRSRFISSFEHGGAFPRTFRRAAKESVSENAQEPSADEEAGRARVSKCRALATRLIWLNPATTGRITQCRPQKSDIAGLDGFRKHRQFPCDLQEDLESCLAARRSATVENVARFCSAKKHRRDRAMGSCSICTLIDAGDKTSQKFSLVLRPIRFPSRNSLGKGTKRACRTTPVGRNIDGCPGRYNTNGTYGAPGNHCQIRIDAGKEHL